MAWYVCDLWGNLSLAMLSLISLYLLSLKTHSCFTSFQVRVKSMLRVGPTVSDSSWVDGVCRDPLTKRCLGDLVLFVSCLRRALSYFVKLFCFVSYGQMGPNIM